MWKSHPEEKSLPLAPPTQRPLSGPSAPPSTTGRESQPMQSSKTSKEAFRAEITAHIGKAVIIKGELSGSEDLYLDGEVEGSIALQNHTLIVGPNGRIRANIGAREVVVHGRIEGNITGAERVELKQSCVLTGDIHTRRIVIDDGAFFKGQVDLQAESEAEAPPAAVAAAGIGAVSGMPFSSQSSFLEHS